MKINDIIIDNKNELQVKNGDFFVSTANKQTGAIIIETEKGQFLNSIETGVGLTNYLNSPFSRLLQQQLNINIQKELEKDGFFNYNSSFSYDLAKKTLNIKNEAERKRL